MKLKQFTPDSFSNTRTISPAISVSTKSGLFAINRAAADLIGLKAGDAVTFHQDEEDTGNWFIEKVREGGFLLRNKDEKVSTLFFNNVSMAKEIFKSVDYQQISGRLLVAGKPTKVAKQTLFGLLTGTLVNT